LRLIRNRPGDTGPKEAAPEPCVVAIGNFDGLHLGHRALIERCREKRNDDSDIAVMTFEPLPQSFFRPEHAPARLSTVYQKLSLLREAGVDRVWMMRFDAQLAGLSAQEFVQQALVQSLNAKSVVVGDDFRFGRGREGDVAMLRELGRELGFEVSTVAAVKRDGQRISSSGIREKLAAGDFKTAQEWLGRPFRMEGHVVPGARLGRKLGFPTANLHIRAQPSPLQGVFAVFARTIGGPWLPAVSSLGWRPVVDGKEPLLEVHFFDFDQDLYGQRLEVQFVAKLRDELDFDSMDDLVDQMNIDAGQARARLARTKTPE
jgi:riboflavin kinase/FMN adenylyltransferase